MNLADEFGLYLGAAAALLFVLFIYLVYRDRNRRRRRVEPCGPRGREWTRAGDIEFNKGLPGSFIKYETDDGPPNGRRGRVWSQRHRDQKKVAKLRIVQ